MNVSLTPELELFVSKKVESGLYQTASEVIREGLRLLREKDDLKLQKLDDLRREIAIGLDQAREGKVAPLKAKETLTRIRAERKARSGTKR